MTTEESIRQQLITFEKRLKAEAKKGLNTDDRTKFLFNMLRDMNGLKRSFEDYVRERE